MAAGAVAATPAPAAAAPPPPPPPPPPPAAPAPAKRAGGRIIATPYAKKLAKDLGVSLETVAGSGPNGRITAADVEAMKNGGGAPRLGHCVCTVEAVWRLSRTVGTCS